MSEKYYSQGKGKKTMVFVHYFGGDAHSWQWLVKRLQKKYNCVVLNLPGFGGTPPLEEPSIYGFANYINSCVKELKLEDYILCGHSMGAKFALYAAKLMPTNPPKHVVLIAPSPPTVEHMTAQERQRMLKHPDRAEAIQTVKGATVKNLRKIKFDQAVASQLKIDPTTWKWWLLEGMRHNIAERIKDLEMGITVIYAREDPVIPEAHIHSEVLPYIQKPSTVALGKVGHLMPMEAPRKLARQLHRIAKQQLLKPKESPSV